MKAEYGHLKEIISAFWLFVAQNTLVPHPTVILVLSLPWTDLYRQQLVLGTFLGYDTIRHQSTIGEGTLQAD